MFDVRKTIEVIRDIVNAPTLNLILLLGFVSIFVSFCRLDGSKFWLVLDPNWILLFIGIILSTASILLFAFTREIKIRRIKIQDGISFKFGPLLANLKVGKIEETPELRRDSAVVLPANTTFIDDCVTDSNSSLGAFCLRHFPNKIQGLVKDIENQLIDSGYQRNNDGSYPLGTTIILPKDYDTPAKVIMTASTIRKGQSGIRAEPSSICECVRQTFTVTADKKISKLYMPVLGSGHGGLDINDALLFLLLAIKHYSQYYHHIKSIEIIITGKDIPKIKDISKVQYFTS